MSLIESIETAEKQQPHLGAAWMQSHHAPLHGAPCPTLTVFRLRLNFPMASQTYLFSLSANQFFSFNFDDGETQKQPAAKLND